MWSENQQKMEQENIKSFIIKWEKSIVDEFFCSFVSEYREPTEAMGTEKSE